jgi:hypothetical protein
MITLRIEHAISDYDTWQRAFDAFADVRTKAGVLRYAIRQPASDPAFLSLDLEFGSTGQAEAFEAFLRANVWSSPEASPALAGKPRTQILDLRRAE